MAAIFDTHFIVLPSNDDGRPHWTVDIYPETASDPDELDELNHVAIQLHVTLPETYPDEALPTLRVEILKGLADDPHRTELQNISEEEAASNEGLPSIYAVTERLREWLLENNRPGLDDISMYAQMMRKQRDKELQEKKSAQAFESQTTKEEVSTAELEELAVTKRRAEGTPCNTRENFEAWKARFEEEMQKAEEEDADDAANEGGDKKKKATSAVTSKLDRIPGFDFFSEKTNNYEALEAAAELAGEQEGIDEDEDDDSLEDVDEDLFDEDVDLDDLDFEDDEDEDEDDELDI